MRLKSYHSASVESAMRLARIELGDEAVFLGSRRNDVGSGPKQAYEVTFAVLEAAADEPAAAAAGGAGTSRAPLAASRAPNRRPAASGGDAAEWENDGGNGANEQQGLPPPAGGVTLDQGAFLSWKKLLRHVTTRGGDSDGEQRPPRDDAEASEAPPPANLARGAASPTGGARGGAALPHWLEFVPGEMREPPNGRGAMPSDAARLARAAEARQPTASPPRPAALQHRTVPLAAPAPLAASAPPAASVPLAATAPAHRTVSPPQRSAPLAPRTDPDAPDAPHPAAPPRNGAGSQAAVSTAAEPVREKARGSAPPPEPVHSTEVYSLQKLSAELEELRRMLERQQAGGAPLLLPSRELLSDNRLAGFYRGLSNNGVDPSLAAELVGRLQEAVSQGAERHKLGALLGREIRSRFRVSSELGAQGAARAVAALVGPSGAGKTTALAKLAFRCGLLERRRVRLVSVDQLRIGAVEPLQAYAELMNAPLEIVDEFEKLPRALDAAPSVEGERELLLIDTPGYGRREWERAQRLAAAFLERGDIDVHLVLDLRTKTDDLRRAIEQFRIFRPAKLLFTRLDETSTFGAMLNETVRTGLPLSFVSVGQRVPEDIVPAGEPELLRLLLKDRFSN